MSKSAIRVVVRTKPTTNFARENLDVKADSNTIIVNLPRKDNSVLNNQRENYSFQFDGVLHDASQEQVFEECALDIISNAIEGYNSTIIAYGQTGAGKTYTMTGTTSNFKKRGLIPRIIDQIFYEVNNRSEKVFQVSMSYLEIYNESLYDLLVSQSGYEVYDESVQILEDSSGSVLVRGLSRITVTDKEEALGLMFQGEANRAQSEHQLNKSSSRSHCIVTLYIESTLKSEPDGKVLRSKLHLVDLAGSERAGKSRANEAVLREAMYINKSLTFLEQVVVALSNPSREHVPYRQSKLTHVLKDSIGGNCKTLVIANIWSELSQIEETLSTLKFASRVMGVTNYPQVNETLSHEAQIKRYEKFIKELKKELEMKDQLRGTPPLNYDPYTDDQKFELRQYVRKYIDDEVDTIEIQNVRQILEIFSTFKTIVKEAEEDRDIFEKSIASRLRDGDYESPTHEAVGEVDYEQGFSAGIAMPSSKFKTKSRATKLPNSTAPTIPNQATKEVMKPMEESEAYEKFKIEDGKEEFEQLREKTTTLKSKQTQLLSTTEQMNNTRTKVNDLKKKIEDKRAETKGREEELADNEEIMLFNELKSSRDLLKQLLDDRKQLTTEIEGLSKEIETSRVNLVNHFEEWYEREFGVPLPPLNTDSETDQTNQFNEERADKDGNDNPESAFYRARKKTSKQLANRVKMPPINKRRM